jgi:hypothetical protein
MSYRKRPTGEPRRGPVGTLVSLARTVVDRLRTHVATWPKRFVDMQAEAFGEK